MKKVGLIQDTTIQKSIPLVDVKFTHALCIGQTGSGKTTSFIYPNLKKRMELGHGILFFDIKGSEHLAVKKLAKETGRLEDVVEVGKPWGENINLIRSLNSRTFESLLIDLVGDPKEGGSNTYFYNGAIELGKIVYKVFKLQSIISKELIELDKRNITDFKSIKEFSFSDFYLAIQSIDSVYSFIQDIKKFESDITKIIGYHHKRFTSLNKQLLDNILLNLYELQTTKKFLDKYDVEADKRDDRSNFDSSLVAVISTLVGSFSFMISESAKYVSEKENPLDFVKALQEKKIIVINVRVIPDSILRLLLSELFEELIDLNNQQEKEIQPASIFIDEAQRLIDKDIPLDVLRSSKVDVLLASQSELQFISKFRSSEDWAQISINIAQKFTFRSSFIGGGELLASFYGNPSTLQTFEYLKEHDTKLYRADPIFMDKKELEKIEMTYQQKILQLKELKKDEIFIYDVTHFENEREIVSLNIKTKKKGYKKIFSTIQSEVIQQKLQEVKKEIRSSMVDSVEGFFTIDYVFSGLYDVYEDDEDFQKFFNSLTNIKEIPDIREGKFYAVAEDTVEKIIDYFYEKEILIEQDEKEKTWSIYTSFPIDDWMKDKLLEYVKAENEEDEEDDKDEDDFWDDDDDFIPLDKDEIPF